MQVIMKMWVQIPLWTAIFSREILILSHPFTSVFPLGDLNTTVKTKYEEASHWESKYQFTCN